MIGVYRPGEFEEVERGKVVEVDSKGGMVLTTRLAAADGGRACLNNNHKLKMASKKRSHLVLTLSWLF
jgi:hypothetical protein